MSNNKEKSDSGNFLVQGSILAAAGIIVRFIGLIMCYHLGHLVNLKSLGWL